MYPEILVAVGVLLAVIGNMGYLVSAWRREISPHPITWFVGSVVSAVTFFGAWVKGGGVGVIPILASEIFTILIFLLTLRLSFKNSFSNVRKIDLVFLGICILGIIPWYLTNDPTWSVVTVVAVDVVSFLPTLLKTRHDPSSENGLLFVCNILRHFIILLTLENINIATSLHSFAMFIVNTIMIFYIYKKNGGPRELSTLCSLYYKV